MPRRISSLDCVHRLTGGEESYCFLRSNRTLNPASVRTLVFHGVEEAWPLRCDWEQATLCPFRDAGLSNEGQHQGRLVACAFCHKRHRENSTAKRLCEEWHNVKDTLKRMRAEHPGEKKYYRQGTVELPYSVDTTDLVRCLIWLRLRSAIMRRDGHACQDCGVAFERARRKVFDPSLRRGKGGFRWEYLEVHHIVPRSRGGSDHPGNLKTLCPSCHRKYTSELMVDVVQEKRRERELLRVLRDMPDEGDYPWDFGGE